MHYKNKILKKNFSHFIFDIDGVILDSKNNMRLSWIKTNNKFNLKKSFKEYFENIGLPFFEILNKIGIKEHYKKIEIEYKKNSINYSNKIKLYKNIKKFFTYLDINNIDYFIVTSKDLIRSKKFLDNYKIFPKSIHCPSNKYKGKPYPDLLNHCVKINKLDKKNTCYVGDTEFDYIAAKKAKINFIFAKYGYGKIKKKYKFLINTPKDLFKFL